MPEPGEMALWRFWVYSKLVGLVFFVGYLGGLYDCWQLGAAVFFLPELSVVLVMAWWMGFLTWKRWFGRPS